MPEAVTSSPAIALSVAALMPGRAIRHLHGVNNGPVGYGSLIDVTHHFREIAVPSVRLHDPEWPHPRSVDMYAVFPDPAADPDDRASYDFLRTDEYLASVVRTGASIVYRLGVSIEHTAVKRYTHPPADPERWARVCVRIIDHYNNGWAGGFFLGIRHWEIWNEPDLGPQMWSGTAEEYFELYRVTATAIRRAHPGVKVGGPGAAHAQGDLVQRFVAFCEQEELPLDFLSWHAYRDAVASVTTDADFVRALLDRHGFRDTESHLNEWNLLAGNFWNLWESGNELERRRVFEVMRGPRGAAFDAAVLMALQDHGVDVANYYDGQPSALFCGLFDPYGVPLKPYHAFRAFLRLAEAGGRLAVTAPSLPDDLFACAAGSGAGDAVLLLSNTGGAVCRLHIAVDAGSNPGEPDFDHLVVDPDHDLEPLAPGSAGAAVRSADGTVRVVLTPSSVHLLAFTARVG